MLQGFLRSVDLFPKNTALIVNGKKFTYEWLLKEAIVISRALQVDVYSKSQLVGLYTDNNEFTYAALIGILLANKGFIPLNHKFPNERLDKIIGEAGIETIVHCGSSRSRISGLSISFSLVIDELKNTSQYYESYEPNDEQIVYILFTSGSTGTPKGIPITNKNFKALILALNTRYAINESDKVLQAFELSFDVSLACTFMAWEYGAALIVPEMDGIVAVNSFKAIYEYGVTFVTIPPSTIFYLKKLKILGAIKIPNVHTTLFTGEALPFKLVTQWKTSAENTLVENAYGPTETTVWCLFDRLDENTESETINGLCPIGKTLRGLNYMVVDDQNEPVHAGERGELLVEGDQIFMGYWKSPEKSAEVFFTDDIGKRWYKTGDIVVENNSGKVIYINRKDNQVQINGFRVELGEVEHGIKKTCGFEGVVVLSKSSESHTELHAFIDGDFSEEELKEKLKETLPFYMIPRNFVKVSPLPLNTNGKIDRKELRREYLS